MNFENYFRGSQYLNLKNNLKNSIEKLCHIFTAKPGMGKTSSLAYLGMKWVEEPGRSFDVIYLWGGFHSGHNFSLWKNIGLEEILNSLF